MLMSYGIMLALWVRERTGRGQQVETSLLQAALAMQTTSLIRIEDDIRPPVDVGGPAYGIYHCADGQYLNICALQADQFSRLCQALALPHLAGDSRFNKSIRIVSRTEFDAKSATATMEDRAKAIRGYENVR